MADAEVRHEDRQGGSDYEAYAVDLAVGQLIGDQGDEGIASRDSDFRAFAPPKRLELSDQLL